MNLRLLSGEVEPQFLANRFLYWVLGHIGRVEVIEFGNTGEGNELYHHCHDISLFEKQKNDQDLGSACNTELEKSKKECTQSTSKHACLLINISFFDLRNNALYDSLVSFIDNNLRFSFSLWCLIDNFEEPWVLNYKLHDSKALSQVWYHDHVHHDARENTRNHNCEIIGFIDGCFGIHKVVGQNGKIDDLEHDNHDGTGENTFTLIIKHIHWWKIRVCLLMFGSLFWVDHCGEGKTI